MKTSHFSLYAFHCGAVGYLHVYVANGTEAKSINFDNLYITTMQGKTRQINHYYPYGMRMRLGHGKKYNNLYTGKELQTGEYWDASVSTGLEMYDFGSRFYDPALGSPDGFRLRLQWFVPDPATDRACVCTEQFANPYLAMGNNPAMAQPETVWLVYVDPDREFAFVPLLIGMAYGALIGAATSAAIYSVQAGINGTWNWDDFGKTVAFGAVGGALGGGLGYVGSQIGNFGQSLGYNILSNVAGNSATTLSFGGDITSGALAGMVLGGALGSGIGNFKGVKGGALKNIGAELAFGTSKGAVTGFLGTGVGIAVDGMTDNIHANPGQSLLNGTVNGAIAGGTVAELNIGIMGATYLPRERGFDVNGGENGPAFRSGTFLWQKGSGMAIGNNLVTRFEGNFKADNFLIHHEYGPYVQMQRLGMGEFYKRGFKNLFMREPYDTPGTLEHGANIYSLSSIGYFYSYKFDRYIYPESYNIYYPNAKSSIFY